MNVCKNLLFSIPLYACFMFVLPQSVSAVDLVVEHTLTDPGHFTTIQAAINYVTQQTGTTTSFRIVVQPSTRAYTGPVTLINNVPILGKETAGTIISGAGSGTIFTANNISTTIQNLTLISAGIGIDISNNSSVDVRNNVFQLGTEGTAVRITNSAASSIINNTFYANNVAIQTDSDIRITNNIFSNNTQAISAALALTKADYNTYHPTGSEGNVILDVNSLPNTSVSNADPLFVAPASRDFHLKTGSPCHAYSGHPAGNPLYPNRVDPAAFDMGAYGGPQSDAIPARVTGVSSSATSTTSVAISWSASLDYLVAGYNVYSGLASGAYTTVLPVTGATGTVVSGLTSTSAPPAQPTMSKPQPRDESLLLSWSGVPTATSYILHYALASAPTLTIDRAVGNVTSYLLTGLVNYETYVLAVSAVSQPTLYTAVTASYPSTCTAAVVGPGTGCESDYSDETRALFGDAMVGLRSDPSVTGIPERLMAFPELPNTGCFIATAAYGSAEAAPVRILRDFRDRRLLTNSAGRAVIAWYYRTSPSLAKKLNGHPLWKPAVRAALAPIVLAAAVLTYMPWLLIPAAALALAPLRKRIHRRRIS